MALEEGVIAAKQLLRSLLSPYSHVRSAAEGRYESLVTNVKCRSEHNHDNCSTTDDVLGDPAVFVLSLVTIACHGGSSGVGGDGMGGGVGSGGDDAGEVAALAAVVLRRLLPSVWNGLPSHV